MGNEFLRKQREGRAKGWNRQLRAGAQDMLVALEPGQELGCRASVHGEMPPVGRKLMLQLIGGAIVVRDENVCIGEVNQPKPELLQDLQHGAGLAVAQVRSRLEAASCIDLVVER